MAAISETSPRALMAFGLLFFLGHIPIVVANVRAATTRDDRLESLGLLIRAVPGLLLALSVLAWPWPVVGFALLVAAVPTLVLGRAVYELIVFGEGAGR